MIKARLLEQFRRWKGVRYQWGGTDVDGIDCSALTQEIYTTAFKKRLPRTAGEQIKEGQAISVGQLQPGDLVFFKPKKSARHVGIYMGNHQFMHASSSQGVILSSLENPFWMSHYETARRIAG
jgi:lipoprotein Spr